MKKATTIGDASDRLIQAYKDAQFRLTITNPERLTEGVVLFRYQVPLMCEVLGAFSDMPESAIQDAGVDMLMVQMYGQKEVLARFNQQGRDDLVFTVSLCNGLKRLWRGETACLEEPNSNWRLPDDFHPTIDSVNQEIAAYGSIRLLVESDSSGPLPGFFKIQTFHPKSCVAYEKEERGQTCTYYRMEGFDSEGRTFTADNIMLHETTGRLRFGFMTIETKNPESEIEETEDESQVSVVCGKPPFVSQTVWVSSDGSPWLLPPELASSQGDGDVEVIYVRTLGVAERPKVMKVPSGTKKKIFAGEVGHPLVAVKPPYSSTYYLPHTKALQNQIDRLSEVDGFEQQWKEQGKQVMESLLGSLSVEALELNWGPLRLCNHHVLNYDDKSRYSYKSGTKKFLLFCRRLAHEWYTEMGATFTDEDAIRETLNAKRS